MRQAVANTQMQRLKPAAWRWRYAHPLPKRWAIDAEEFVNGTDLKVGKHYGRGSKRNVVDNTSALTIGSA